MVLIMRSDTKYLRRSMAKKFIQRPALSERMLSRESVYNLIENLQMQLIEADGQRESKTG